MAENKINNPVLISFLERNREQCNQKFVQYKFQYPYVQGTDFQFYFGFYFEDFVSGKKTPSDETLLILYERILELLCKNIIGNRNRYPEFETYFSKLLFFPLELIEVNPEKFFIQFSNLMINVLSIDRKLLTQFFKTIEEWISYVQTQEELFQLGNIILWLIGLSAYRSIALEILPSLNENLKRAIFKLDSNSEQQKRIESLKSNYWISLDGKYKEKEMHKIGGNIILGGLFYSSPKVYTYQNHFFLKDSENIFLLHFDYYGYQLQRISDRQFFENLKDQIPSLEKISSYQNLELNRISLNILSIVDSIQEVCFTLKDSYSVFILNRMIP